MNRLQVVTSEGDEGSKGTSCLLHYQDRKETSVSGNFCVLGGWKAVQLGTRTPLNMTAVERSSKDKMSVEDCQKVKTGKER